MRRRTKIILALGAVVLLALGWVALQPEKEPEYNGKKLSQWVIETYSGTSPLREDPEYVLEAKNAIRVIGTNAIPYLLKWIDYEIPGWMMDKGFYGLEKLIEHSGIPLRVPAPRRALLSLLAQNGFQALGSIGDPAAPELSRLLYKHKHKENAAAYRIADALGSLGTNGCSYLVTALTNSNVLVRRYAARGLRFSTNSATAFAVPVLLASLNDPDEEVAAAAAFSYLLTFRPDLSIPPLIKALTDERAKVKQNAMWGLSRLGSQASNALPKLSLFLEDEDFFTRQRATNVIRHIDPNALPK